MRLPPGGAKACEKGAEANIRLLSVFTRKAALILELPEAIAFVRTAEESCSAALL